MTYFMRRGIEYRVSSKEALDLRENLDPDTYTIKYIQPFDEYYLEKVDSYTYTDKLYGSVLADSKRVLNTFVSRPYSTGAMFVGEKGSGKTLMAKIISILGREMGIPTLLVNTPLCGDTFNKFIQTIEQPCIIFFDEFEKIYNWSEQEKILTLMDGSFPTKKLFLVTSNDLYRIDEFMRNRPGRMYYMLEFSGLSEEYVREYCKDTLVGDNRSYADEICRYASMFEQFNFDMLKALVEEVNRYNEHPRNALRMLNIKPDRGNKINYTIELWIGGQIIGDDHLIKPEWFGNPLTQNVAIEFSPEAGIVPIQSRKLRATTNNDREDDSDEPCSTTRDELAASLTNANEASSPKKTNYVVNFDSSNLIKIDNGVYVFADEHNNKLMLTRKYRDSFDWRAF